MESAIGVDNRLALTRHVSTRCSSGSATALAIATKRKSLARGAKQQLPTPLRSRQSSTVFACARVLYLYACAFACVRALVRAWGVGAEATRSAPTWAGPPMIPLVMPHNAIAPQSSPYNMGEMVFVDMGVAVTFVPLIHVGANVTFPGGGLGASPAVTHAILRATCWVCVGGRGYQARLARTPRPTCRRSLRTRRDLRLEHGRSPGGQLLGGGRRGAGGKVVYKLRDSRSTRMTDDRPYLSAMYPIGSAVTRVATP